MYCPLCGDDLLADYAYNAVFDAYNFSCERCNKRYFLFTTEVNNA